MTEIEEIQELTRRLNSLIVDPHPGLLSWNESYNEVMGRMMAVWQRGKEANNMRIVVNGVFDGSPEEWKNCFFDNFTVESVVNFCLKHGWSVTFSGK